MQRQLPGRFREQARSHTEIRRAADGRPAVALLWERACSRRGWVGQCSGNCQDAFASKPAPTLKTSRRQWPVSRRSSVRAGLLAKRLGQSMQRQLTGRFREQARSHTENVAPPMAGQPSLFCGSGLAREEAGSVDAAATDRAHSRASPLPHSNTPPPMAGQPSLFCESGLAREEAGSVNAAATARTLSRASPLPHSNSSRRRWPASRRSSVRAGLLAKRLGQSMQRQLTGHFREQARSHIQIRRRRWPASRRSSVGAGLLAKRLGQSMQRQLTGHFREQARSHTQIHRAADGRPAVALL